MNIPWTDMLVLAAVALAALVVGACEAALRALSRSRLTEELAARGLAEDKVPVPLRRIAAGDPAGRLSASMLHSVVVGAFMLLGAGLLPEGPRGERWALLAGLFAVIVMLRGLSVMAGGVAPERMLLALWRPVWLLTLPLRPLAELFLRGEKLFARGLGTEWDDEEERREGQLIAAVSDGALDGVVAEGQRDMIAGVVELKDADVADVFTPRTRMVAVEVSMPLEEAIRTGLDSGHSRLPVYEDTRDRIVGVFHLRDALAHWDKPPAERPELKSLLHKAMFVPETTKVSDLLQEMQREQTHLAVVLDEYGGTAGLVTIEDVLEEIVGEIRDEYDREDDSAPVRAVGSDTFVAEGTAHVAEVNEAFGADLLPEDDDYETVAGFVLDQLGHIPAAGESFTCETEEEGLRLAVKVLTADERHVGRVSLQRLPPE